MRIPDETRDAAANQPAPGTRGPSRRQFLQQAGGLTLGFYLAPRLAPAAAQHATASDAAALFAPNAFVRIAADNSVTVVSKHLEMGQGTFTGLATLLAEELDADWHQVRVEAAPADVKRYANLLLGMQLTGGSTAMANSYEQMRMAGATARAMLVAAAAQQWRVAVDSISGGQRRRRAQALRPQGALWLPGSGRGDAAGSERRQAQAAFRVQADRQPAPAAQGQ